MYVFVRIEQFNPFFARTHTPIHKIVLMIMLMNLAQNKTERELLL